MAFLDPRPSAESSVNPIPGAVNIPFAELPDRIFELPAKHELVEVADVGEVAGLAVNWLQSQGRFAQIAQSAAKAEDLRGRLWSPNEFLAECLPQMEPGLAVDLACGSGRDAVYLASCGWSVLAIDILPDAIDRGQRLAKRYAREPERIDWRVENLRRGPEELSSADLVTMFFFLDRGLIREVVSQMQTGAKLMIETFTTVHRERFGKPASMDRVLGLGEAQALASGLEIIRLSEDWRSNHRHTARLLAKKP